MCWCTPQTKMGRGPNRRGSIPGYLILAMTIQKLINKLKSLPESDKHTEISSCFIPAIVHATNLTYNSAKVYQYDSRDTHVLINVDHIVSIQPPIEAPLAVDKEEHDRILISVTNQEMNERVSISYADYLKLIS